MEGERIVPMRLQRFLARAGVASRRGSERLMTEGRVRVNGVVVSELGSKVDPIRDTVEVDGHIVGIADAPVYLMLNKPEGYLTTMSDPQGRPTIKTMVPTKRYPGLFPVGRLDMDTSGRLPPMAPWRRSSCILLATYGSTIWRLFWECLLKPSWSG